MNKKVIFLTVLIVLFVLLSGCGSSLSIQLPEAEGSGEAPVVVIPATGDSGTAPAQGGFDNMMLIYVLIGAVVLIALIAVLGAGAKRSSE
jgi:uncharacterized protein YceK